MNRRAVVALAAVLGVVGVATSARVDASALRSSPAPTEPSALSDSNAPPEASPDDAVDAARAGLAAFLATNRPPTPSTSFVFDGCPAIEQATFEAALEPLGLPTPLGDWGVEIEWDEYAALGPDVMGIACRGDADGDAEDSDFGMYGGIVAVDVGSSGRVDDVYQLLGFGTLEPEAADVPGGEVASTCDTSAGLSVCLSFWNAGGLVIGVNLWSSEQEIPTGSATDVLSTVLPDVLTTLGAYAAPPADSGPGETEATFPATGVEPPSELGAARAGLARLLASSPDTGENEPLGPCTLVDDDEVDVALETAGIDAPLDSWEQELRPVAEHRAVLCHGAHAGASDDPNFPELAVTLTVTDLGEHEAFAEFLATQLPSDPVDDGLPDELPTPEIGGATVGACAKVDRSDWCTEYWESDGFVVGLQIADQVYVDRPAVSAALGELVPDVLASLGSEASDITDPLAAITSDEVSAALAGLPAVPAEGDCVALSLDDLTAALAATDATVATENWAANELPRPLEGAVVARQCTGGHGESSATLTVADFGDAATADDFVASVGLAEGGTAADLPPGEPVIGSCTRVEGSEYCAAWWRSAGLVIGVQLFGDAPDVAAGDATEVLVDVVPTVLANVAAA